MAAPRSIADHGGSASAASEVSRDLVERGDAAPTGGPLGGRRGGAASPGAPPRSPRRRPVEAAPPFLASGLRFGLGTFARRGRAGLRRQPDKLLELYEFEACP